MMRSDTVESLEKEDREFLPVLSELEDILAAPGDVFPDRLREIARGLRADLGRHLALEERALFPVVERHLPRGGGPLEILEQDHRSIRRLLETLALAVERHDPTATRKAGQALLFVLRKHLEEEHRILFPVVFRMFTSEDRRMVAAEMKRYLAEESAGARGEHEEGKEGRLDVRGLPVWGRPEAISRAFARLREEEALEVVSTEEPSALYHPFAAEWAGSFEWKAEERGPREWLVRIRKVASAPSALGVLAAGPSHTLCG